MPRRQSGIAPRRDDGRSNTERSADQLGVMCSVLLYDLGRDAVNNRYWLSPDREIGVARSAGIAQPSTLTFTAVRGGSHHHLIEESRACWSSTTGAAARQTRWRGR